MRFRDYKPEVQREIEQNEWQLGRCKVCKTSNKSKEENRTVRLRYDYEEFMAYCCECGRHTDPYPRAFLAVKAWNGGKSHLK